MAPITVPGEKQLPSTEARDGLDAPARVLTIAVALRSLRQLRFYQSMLELLTARGHRVTLMIEARRREVDESAWLEQMAAHENFDYRRWNWDIHDRWLRRSKRIGAAMEHVHFKLPPFRDRRRYLREKKSPKLVRVLASVPGLRGRRGLGVLYNFLSLLDRSNPQPSEPREWLEELRPDVFVVGDTGCRGGPGPFSVAFTVAGLETGIPTLGCVSSWDNLTTRPRLRVLPHRLAVWNDLQLEEAESIHRMPRERVVVTGAPGFDSWFDWEPTPRDQFLERLGLPPERPLIFWACSCIYLWEPPEVSLVVQWLEALRLSSHPVLRDAAVLVRPHPLRAQPWTGVDLSSLGPAVVWPNEDVSFPTNADRRANYFDSIYHSRAIVGINTSAMIEGSIVGRPVLSFVDDAYEDSQSGAIHFEYLLEKSGGPLRLAGSLQEHTEDLARLLTGGDAAGAEASRRFVARFVRPGDLTVPATSRLVGAIESLADVSIEPISESWPLQALRGLVVVVSAACRPVSLAWTPVRAFYDPKTARRLRRKRTQLRKRVGRWSHKVGGAWIARRMRKAAGRLRAAAAFRRTGSALPPDAHVSEEPITAEKRLAVDDRDASAFGVAPERDVRIEDASRGERAFRR